MQTNIFYSHYTDFFFIFYYIFFRDWQRSNAISDSNIASSAIWKKRTKNFFDHYSLFQPRIKCISTSHSKCDILWLIFWWHWWWGIHWRFWCFFIRTFPVSRFYSWWWWTWWIWWQGTVPLAFGRFSIYFFIRSMSYRS